jgi:hypothetical protein
LNVIKTKFFKQYGVLAILALSYLGLSSIGLGIACPIHAATGFYCPGCGSTRAVKAVLNGDLPLAFHDNALLMVSPVVIASGLLIEKYSQKRIWLYAFLSVVLVVVVVFTVIRNQPGSELAPL